MVVLIDKRLSVCPGLMQVSVATYNYLPSAGASMQRMQ